MIKMNFTNKKVIFVILVFVTLLSSVIIFKLFSKPKDTVNDKPTLSPKILLTPANTAEIPGSFSNLYAYINKNIVNDVIIDIKFNYSGKTNQFVVDISLDPTFPLTEYWRFVVEKPNILRVSREDTDNEFPCSGIIYWRITTKNQIVSPTNKTRLYCPTKEETTPIASPTAKQEI